MKARCLHNLGLSVFGLFFSIFYSLLTINCLWAWTDTGGGDHGGADWTPVNGSTIAGTHTNIGTFTIPAGATVYVRPYDGGAITPLLSDRGYGNNDASPSGFVEIDATNVTIDGLLEASERGYRGGDTSSGEGPGGGGMSSDGSGGGAYGGSGGTGILSAAGGSLYGNQAGPLEMGSGGGGTSNPSDVVNGGDGGGLVIITASSNLTISSFGEVQVNGGAGTNNSSYETGTGGGAGGGIYLNAPTISLNGAAIISAAGGGGARFIGGAFPGHDGKGGDSTCAAGIGGNPGIPGDGGNYSCGVGGYSAGGAGTRGGGGGAGRILISYQTINGSTYVDGAYWNPPVGGMTIGPYPWLVLKTPPNDPSNLTLNLGGDSISLNLSWQDNATDETGFSLERSVDGFAYTLVDGSIPLNPGISPPFVTYPNTGLSPNTTYWYHVRAFSATGGNSNWAIVASPMATRASVPGTGSTNPSEIYVTSMTVTWLNNTTNPNPAGTTYICEMLDSPGGNLLDQKTATEPNRTATFTILAPNTTYYFQVKAVNHGGVETAYNSSWLTVTRASKPESTGLSNVTFTAIQADWTQGNPANPPAITDYVCEISTDETGFGSLINQATIQNLTYTFTNLIQNSTYYVQVKAVNHAGVSSGYIYLGKATTQTSAPSSLQFQGVYESSVSLSWSGGQGSGGYRIEASPDNSDFDPLAGSTTVYTTNGTVFNLGVNVLCYFRVGNLNVQGVGAWAGSTPSAVTLARIPDPAAVADRITNRAGISITAAWGANGNPSPSTAYILEASTKSNFIPITSSVTATATNATVGNLSPNKLYYLQVKAKNLADVYTNYAYIGSTTTLSPPPDNVQFQSVWNSSATLIWTNPAPASGDEYILDWSKYNDLSASVSTNSFVFDTTTLTATGLDINTTYYFRVGAKNAGGEYSPAPIESTSTLANPPLPGSFTGVGPTTITANWGYNGNPDGVPASEPLTNYQVQASTTSNFSLINQITTPNELGNYTGLISQTTYYLRVRALNHSGVPTNWVALGSTATIVTISVSTAGYTTPATVLQDTEIAILRLTLNTNGSVVTWMSLALEEEGSSLDSDIEEVRIYRDNQSAGTPGTYDGADPGIYVPGTRFTGGQATVGIAGGGESITAAQAAYFIVCKVANAAGVEKTIRTKIPSTNSFTFVKTLSPLDTGIWQIQGSFPSVSDTTTIQDNNSLVTFLDTDLAPASKPKGNSEVAMLRIWAKADTGTADITSFLLTRTGTAGDGDISSIKIYRSIDSTFDPPGSPSPDTMINAADSGGFSGSTTLVTLDSPQTITTNPAYFFVIVDIPPSANTDNTFGVKIDQPGDISFSRPTDTAASANFPLASTNLTITDFPNILTVTVTDHPAPPTGTQGNQAPMLKMTMSVNTGFARWTGLRVNLGGTELSTDVGEAQLYKDLDGSGIFSTGDGTYISTAAFQGGTTTFSFSTEIINAGTPQTYFVVYLIHPNAIPDNTLTAKFLDASYLTVITPNTSKTASSNITSGSVVIEPTRDTVTFTPADQQPVPASVIQGDTNVAMARFKLSLDANAATFTGLRLDRTGSCADADITAIKIWRDVDTDGVLDTGDQGDQLISSGLDTFFNNVANLTLSIPQDVPVTPAYQDYFVSFSFSPSATVGAACGLNMATTNYVTVANPGTDTVANSNFPMLVQATINEYPDTIYITTTSIAPSTADPGTPNVPMLKLVMNTGFSDAPWRSVQFDRTGTATSSDMGLIKLWMDRNANSSLDVAQDAPALVSASFPNGFATLTLNINPNETINLTPKTYFVTADISASATPNRQFGLLAVNNNYFLTQSPNTISTTTITGYTAFPFQSGTVTINEPPSEVTAIPISLAPSEVIQESQNVPFMYISLRTNNYTAYWTSLKLDRTGNGDDGDVSRIRFYADDGDGSFEPTTQDTLVQTGNVIFNNNQATLSFSPISITKTDKKFFVTLDISPVAGAGNNIGLRLGNSLYLGYQSPDFAAPITFETNQSLIQPTVDTLAVTVEPVPTTLKQGDINKAVAKISLRADSHAVAWKGLLVTRLGNLQGSGVAALSIWRDSGNGTLDDSDIQIGSAQQPFTGESTLTTVTLNAPETITTSPQLYFLAVSVDRVLATAGETVGFELTDSVAYVVIEPDLVSASPWQSDLIMVNDYTDVLTVNPTSLELEGIYQGQESALTSLALSLNEDSAGLLNLKIKKTGTISDTHITGAKLYLDSNANMTWDKNTDTLISGPVTFSNGLANFAFSPSFSLTPAATTVFVTYAIAANAIVGRTVGCSVPDTSYIVLQGTDAVSGANLPFTGASVPVKDARVPTKPKIAMDNVYTNEPTRLHFQWDSSVFTGTIQEAEYAIGSSSASTDIRAWTKISNSTAIAVSGLALEHGKTYYIKVMTKSDSGFYSDSGISIGVTVDTVKPAITVPPQIVLDRGEILVSWSQATSGPSGIVGYKIEERNAKTAVWSVITPVPPATAPGAVPAPLVTGNSYFIGAKPAGTYYYRVCAVNGAGTEGEPSPAARVVVGPVSDMAVSNAFCYPNPFDSRRTSVNIVYALNQDTDTEIKIYELFGNKVWSKTFGQGEEGGRLGVNTIVWDGTDYNGEKVSFGVHLCEIKPKNGGKAEVKIAVIH